ncbi:MAG: ABC-type multidrug transport system, ATPase component [Parcubacteria group bacterium GW2011_GWA2_43_13]|nr:MAG: ABC-type multidrug transport system, ATPase component [Parcubacteria group bacterium GW2011_GWA2_43_13]
MIEINHLTKKFGDVTAVNNVSFSVQSGEVVGFLGPNGAGKTTTMKIITGYTAPTSGSVSIDGMDIQDHPDETRAKIGYLPERNPLYDEFQVSEYLAFVAELRGVPRAIRASRISEMVQSCGLEKMLHKPIGDLSKGFRQRVGIAQSLVHNPDLIE